MSYPHTVNATGTNPSRARKAAVCLGAVVLLVAAVTAGGDSLATCAPKNEKLYTLNESAIKAEIAKLEAFESDMRAVLQDVKTMTEEDRSNRIRGKVLGYREVINQSNKALCASANMATTVGPSKVTGLKLYAAACRYVEEVAGGINDLIDCANGDCVDVASLFPKGMKGGDKLRVPKMAKILNEGKKAAAKQDTAGGMKAVCDFAATGLEPTFGTAGKFGKEGCAAGTSASKAVEAYQTVQALDSASQENQDRMAKQIQLLEGKITAVSQKIAQLRGKVYAIDWGAMGKPEPNMTLIKQDECDDKLDAELDRLAEGSYRDGASVGKVEGEASAEEVQRALSQMSKPGLLGSLRSPAAETNSSLFNSETAGALLGIAEGLSTISAARGKKDPPPTSSTSQPLRQPAEQSFSVTQQDQTQCRTVTHPAKRGGASTVQIVCDGGNNGKGSLRQETAPSSGFITHENMGTDPLAHP